jgi:hypothetical protein
MTTWSNRSVVLAHQPTDRFVLPFSFNSLACLSKLLFILTSAFVDFMVPLSVDVASKVPAINRLVHHVIEGRYDGIHDFEFGLELILNGLDRLRDKV